MKSLIPVLLIIFGLFLIPQVSNSGDLNTSTDDLRGAKVIAQDANNTYLGTISGRLYSDSIFNEFGKYGSKTSSTSIWNEDCPFGDKSSEYSPFNPYTHTPPVLKKGGRIVGYLTENISISKGVKPSLLKNMRNEFR